MDAQTLDRDRRTLRLRPEAIDDQLKLHGWSTLTEAARACGLAPSTLARCYRGEVDPGPYVVAQLLDGTGAPFDQLFAVVVDDA